MDYFKILNLNREPFSNSPEPEFFFPSTKHLACLQQLELAIRLRRGLNVVMGDVGTGKTTLCRQLILRFTESEDDRNDIQTHLLLDPSFADPHEFLAAVALTFGLPRAEGGESEWQMKESIKDHLFRKGVDENKTVVLIIDEGQKIPDYCLEILREFLNYETNENKLLQIVIFAQNEFTQILKDRENFADRVNQYYHLRPLNFRETATMIRFRIAQAGKPDGARPLFTFPGLLAIYRATGGYPRKIITLCHQVMLTLIIQNRVRAGWFLVRSTAGRTMPDMVREKRWTTTASLLTILVLSLLAFIVFFPGQLDFSRLPFLTTLIVAKPTPALKPEPAVKPAVEVSGLSIPPESIRTASAPATPAKTPPEAPAQMKPAEDPKPEPAAPAQMGYLKIREGGTVLRLLQEIYGNSGTARYRAVIRANPHISDMNIVRAGETIYFPAIPAKSNPLRPEQKWVQVAKKTPDEAYRLYKVYPADRPAVRLIPTRNRKEGLVFLIVMKTGFDSEQEAKDAIGKLPSPLAEGAEIMKPPVEGTVYFAN